MPYAVHPRSCARPSVGKRNDQCRRSRGGTTGHGSEAVEATPHRRRSSGEVWLLSTPEV